MQPKLSFHYSSVGRNGALGVGWSVSGVSAITRAPQTRAQDSGSIHGVDMTLADRYSMDGQRLIAIVGTDGYAGTEYRTELNSFTKVVSNGASGNGPSTFTAWTKSGLIYTFGGANGASFVPPGRADGTILTWLISKIQDQAGNYMTFSYTAEGNLSSVNYAMNDAAGLSSYASVVFTYDATRPDPAVGYVVGSGITMNQRLSRITSYYSTSIVRQYDLAYEVSANTGKSRLISITEGNGAGLTFPPTTFTWDHDPNTLNYTQSTVSGVLDNNHSLAQGDFTGDGICDVVKARGANNTLQIYQIQNGQLVTGGSYTSSQNFATTGDTWLQGDFNGDGKVDVIRVHSSGDVAGGALVFTQFINTGTNGVGTAFTQSNATITGTAPLWYPSRTYFAVDVNGDGKLDIICINGPNPTTGAPQLLTVTAFINQGNGTFNGVQWNYTSASGDPGSATKDYCKSSDRWMVSDFNGDGLPDLTKVMLDGGGGGGPASTSVRIYQNQNGSFLAKTLIYHSPGFYESDGSTFAYTWLTGDFNGDGLVDLARVPKTANTQGATTVSVYLSTASLSTGFTAPQSWLSLTLGESDVVQAGDYNADGRSDLLRFHDQANGGQGGCTTTRSEYLSNGVNGFYLQSTGSYQLPAVPSANNNLTADFNGDGKEDLIRFFGSSSAAYFDISSSTPGYQDLLRQVTDGMGVVASIDYQPLTNPAVFTKSTDAVAPAIDLIEPMPVVATITYDNGLGANGSPGSTYTVSYRYEGLKADPLRGMLGFRSVEAIDNRAVDGQPGLFLHSKTWLKQGFPYTGMAERSSTYLLAAGSTKTFSDHSGLLSDSITTYAAGPVENTKLYFPYAQDSHVYSWDLGGVATNDTETIVPTTGGIDVYGNTLQSTVKTKDLPSANFFVKTTTSAYTTSTSNWRIGQVTGSSVLSQAPGQPDINRNSGFGYNSTNGQVSSETIESGSAISVQTNYTFDAFGNTRIATTSTSDTDVITGQAVPSRTTTTNYDTKGRFVETTFNALNQSESKLYDQRFGGASSVTGPNNLTDTAHYDDFSRKDVSTRADGTTTSIGYEWVSGNPNAPNAPANSIYLVRTTPADGAQGLVYFDRLGREMRKETLSGIPLTGSAKTIFLDTTYDYRGRKSTVTKPYFKGDSATAATSFYDGLDRMVQVQVPSVDENGATVNTVSTNAYNGLTTTATNPKGQQTISVKDAAGHLKQVVDALSGYINYTYDATGNLVQTSDAATNATVIVYDARGRKTSVTDPDLGLWSYTYYSTGELKTQTDAKNQVVKFSYDQLGRMKTRLEPTNDTTAWAYDTATGKGVGKLASVTFTPAQGSQLAPYSNTLNYDNLGRPSSQSTSAHNGTYVTSTTYDQFSRVWQLTYPTGFVVQNLYDANGYLKQITNSDASTTYWQADNYDADGHITEEQYGNGIITDRVYIPQNGLLKTITSGVGGGTGVQNLEYHFDVLGNLKSRKDSNQTISGSVLQETFNYDALNRLQDWTVTGQAQQHVIYDHIGTGTASLGNIVHKDGVGDYTYPAAGSAHPHAVLTAGASGTSVYDSNGNMNSGFGRSITWTWFNQPQLITGSLGSSYFEHDDGHQRVWQHATGSSGIVDTTYIGGFYEKVDDANTTKHKCYIASPTGRIAIYSQTYDKHTFGTTYDTKYLHKDHLGSVDVITDSTGAVLERDSFDAWGFRRTTDWQAQRPIGSMSIVSRGFTDHEELDSLGLVNMNGRIYDPGIGRFVSADPSVQFPDQTQSYNRYSYVLNNPLSFTDPSGFDLLGDILTGFGARLIGMLPHSIQPIVIGLIAVAVVITFQYYVMPAVISMLPATLSAGAALVVSAAGAGFAGAFTSTILAGGSLAQALQSGAIAGGVAALTAGIIGPMFHGIDASKPLGFFEKSLGHGLAGGLLNAAEQKLENGSLRDGFLSGFVSGLASIGIDKVGVEQGQLGIAERTMLSAAVGGTAAELGGGKFANGAITAAFLRLYNDERFASEQSNGSSQKRSKLLSDAELCRQLERAYPMAQDVASEKSDALYFYRMWNEMDTELFDYNGQTTYYSYHGSLTWMHNDQWENFEVNYIAVGEGFAARGYSIAEMNAIIRDWNSQLSMVLRLTNPIPMSSIYGKMAWAMVGYEYYQQRNH